MSFRKSIKRFGRKTAKARVKFGRVATPILSAGAGFIGGAPAAAAVTAIGAQAAYYNRATQARNEGTFGRDARARGRGERKRVAIYGAAGGGAGMLASGAYTLASGDTFSQALGATGLGQGGKALLFGSEGTLFAKAPTYPTYITNLATAPKGSGVPGLVTQSQLESQLAGGATAAEKTAAAAGTGGIGTKLLGAAVSGLSQAKIPGTPGGASPTQPDLSNAYKDGLLDGLLNGMGGGGGGGGGDMSGGGFMNAPLGENSKMSPAVLVGLGLAALILFH